MGCPVPLILREDEAPGRTIAARRTGRSGTGRRREGATADAVVEVQRLCKRFGDVVALEAVSFEVRRGETVGLLGPNGAGKTTTLQLLLGLTTPSAGSMRILGLDVATQRRRILARVNFSSAYIALPSNLTVWENLNVFARLYGNPRPRARIQELLELFEIPHLLSRKTGALSAGQITRVNLCKAFLNDPEVLFLDEPTASLDPDIAWKVRDALRAVQRERGLTMVYTSHDMREVEEMCDRIVFLAGGRVVLEGPPDEVVRRARGANLEEVFLTVARGGRGEAR